MHGDLQTRVGWIHNSHCHFMVSITSCPFNTIKGYSMYLAGDQKGSFLYAEENERCFSHITANLAFVGTVFDIR